MTLGRWLSWLFVLASCGEVGPDVPVVQEMPEPAVTPVAPPVQPAGLYEACRERVEHPEQAQECASDSDCKTVGCSGEVCVKASEEEMLTTCDVLPCYRVLDSCGCLDGRCRWTIRGIGEITAPGSGSLD